MKDEIKNKVAGKAANAAATAVGGPAAGAAAEKAMNVISKVKSNNPNKKDGSENRLSSALGKKNQMPGLGGGDSAKDNNQEEGEEQGAEQGVGSSTDKLKGLANKALSSSGGGASMLKGSANSSSTAEVAEVVQKVQKIAKIINFISPAIPYILMMIVGLIIILLVISQIMIMKDQINSALINYTTGIEKYINFMSGNGWSTEEETFFKNLEEKYSESVTLPTDDGEPIELDVPLIAATVNYSKVTDVGLYEDMSETDIGEEDDDSAVGAFGNYFDGYIQHNQMRNFYYVANDKLGDYKCLLPGNRRLLGHLIGYEIEWKDVSITNLTTIYGQWTKFIGFLINGAVADYEAMTNIDLNYISAHPIIGSLSGLYGIAKTIKEIIAYSSMGENHDDYLEYHLRTFYYELEELSVKCADFINSEWSELISGDEGFFNTIWNNLTTVSVPYVTFHDTSDEKEPYSYGHYLKEVYLPGTFFSHGNYSKDQITDMVREIYLQRGLYYDLVPNTGQGGAAGCIDDYGSDNCQFDLSTVYAENNNKVSREIYSDVRNIKVDLRGYYNENNRIIMTDIPFEKYILGVVYAEVDGYEEEAQKAQAVAARTFALVRPFVMGPEYCSLEKNGDGWKLTLRSSVADQVYCDPEKGCSTTTPPGTQGGDMYSGVDTSTYKYKDPIPADAPIRSYVASTAGQVLKASDGYLIYADFVQTQQTAWNNLAKANRKYTDFLPEYYTNKIGMNVTIGQGNCTASGSGPTDSCSTGTGEKTGDWANWRQFDPEWKDIPLGSRNIGAIGCAATSVSIQIARSKVKATFDPVNPGTFVKAYQNAGGFQGGDIIFNTIDKVAPEFKYVNMINLPGGPAEDVEAVKKAVDEGCYPVMEVKQGNNSGQHWVAVVEVKDGKIIMADPASTETDAISKYGTGLSKFICYKVGG